MTRTFLDSGVLLTAWRGKECCEQALAVMEDGICTATITFRVWRQLSIYVSRISLF
jgi:hypothetical protein